MQNDFRKKALHLFVLSALALAQPFFYVLGENGTFLIAHNVGLVDLGLLTVVLMVGFPLLFISITFLFRHLNKYLHEYVFISLFIFLSGVTALPITKGIPHYSGGIKIFLALLIGSMAYVIYRRYEPVKLFLSYLAPLVFFFPIHFLFYTDASKLLFPDIQENRHPISQLKEESKIPIFLIVLDEFPVTSLMDEHGMIDSTRYPNFDTLSKNSHWFRNAITVAEWTDLAVPAILTGKYPPKTRTLIPLEEDYPDNLFALLEPHYELSVFEELTKLCFSEKCGKPQLSELPQRTWDIYSDLVVLFGHSILPADYSKEIPSIQNRWKNFKSRSRDGSGNIFDDRLERTNNFIDSISSKNKPTLYFLHLTFPHSPTIYLPSGKAYDETENMTIGRSQDMDSWSLDSWVVTQAYQRHLLQVGYTDKLMGRIFEKMKQEGLYDKALLIVTADHGISFLPGERSRGYTQFNYPDILSVPLFIKLPHQKEGALRKEAVKTIDILPTIAATIGLQVPWPMDGENPLSFNPGNKNLTIRDKLRTNPNLEMLLLPRNPGMKYNTLKKKYLLFSSGPEDLLYKIGPRPDLLGLKTEDALKKKLIITVESELDQTGAMVQVDKQINFVPSLITGTIKGLEIGTTTQPKFLTPFIAMGESMDSKITYNPVPTKLAIAINGVIQATTQTDYFSSPDRFSALVPESAYREGLNTISVFKILDGAMAPLNPKKTDRYNHYYLSNKSHIWNKNRMHYRLVKNHDESSSLIDSSGNKIKANKKSIGTIDQVRYSLEAMYFFGEITGWKGPTDGISFMVFNNQQLVYSDQVIIPEFLGFNQSKKTGDAHQLIFRVPVYQNKKVNLNNIRIFLTDSNASIHEMKIAQGVLPFPGKPIPKLQFYGALSYCEDESAPVKSRTASMKASSKNFSNECF